jgi:hypothetical protein
MDSLGSAPHGVAAGKEGLSLHVVIVQLASEVSDFLQRLTEPCSSDIFKISNP